MIDRIKTFFHIFWFPVGAVLLLLLFVMYKQETIGYKNKESKMNKTRVTYAIKDQQGYLVDVERTFTNDRSAIQFIRTLNSMQGTTITGKPLLEKVA